MLFTAKRILTDFATVNESLGSTAKTSAFLYFHNGRILLSQAVYSYGINEKYNKK